MNETNKTVDRRTLKRIEIRDDAFVIIQPFSNRILACIENISAGGLAFCYFSNNKWSIQSMDIMLIREEFFLEKISIKTVSDFEVQDSSVNLHSKMRKQCVKFLNPSSCQQERLNELIRLYHAPVYKGPERRSPLERRRGMDRRRQT